MEGVDREALKAKWDAEDQAAAQREYNFIVTSEGGDEPYNRYKDLCDAFSARDRERFQKIVNEALDALQAADAAAKASKTEEV